ncbi:MAG: alanine racemase [Candidatus Saccharimonadales bacterium]
MIANVALLKKQHHDYDIIPVLKANAYGHGLKECAEILNRVPCPFVAVDGYFEAAQIRDITHHRILVMGYIKPINIPLLDTKRCSFVVQDIESLHAYGRLGKPVRIHIELNTGMNRLGLLKSEIVAYLDIVRRYPSIKIEGIMSHLADADNATDATFNRSQATLFDELVDIIHQQGFYASYYHLAQTAGSTKIVSRYTNTIRFGIGLYGINPLQTSDPKAHMLHNLRPVLTLKSSVIKVIHLQPGDRVSYNGIYTARVPTSIGVLPLGYYEGIPRELSNKGVCLINNVTVPIVGRVCMNHIMVDLKDSGATVGSEVVIISNNPHDPNSIQNISRKHEIFSYSLATGLSSSIRRTIV